jgi:hypothetical protein
VRRVLAVFSEGRRRNREKGASVLPRERGTRDSGRKRRRTSIDDRNSPIILRRRPATPIRLPTQAVLLYSLRRKEGQLERFLGVPGEAETGECRRDGGRGRRAGEARREGLLVIPVVVRAVVQLDCASSERATISLAVELKGEEAWTRGKKTENAPSSSFPLPSPSFSTQTASTSLALFHPSSLTLTFPSPNSSLPARTGKSYLLSPFFSKNTTRRSISNSPSTVGEGRRRR